QDTDLGAVDVGPRLQLVHQGEEQPAGRLLDHHDVQQAVVDPGVRRDQAARAVVAGVGGDDGVAGVRVIHAVDGDAVARGPPGGDGAQPAGVVGGRTAQQAGAVGVPVRQRVDAGVDAAEDH